MGIVYHTHMARRGPARRGEARLGQARQGKARLGTARHGFKILRGKQRNEL